MHPQTESDAELLHQMNQLRMHQQQPNQSSTSAHQQQHQQQQQQNYAAAQQQQPQSLNQSFNSQLSAYSQHHSRQQQPQQQQQHRPVIRLIDSLNSSTASSHAEWIQRQQLYLQQQEIDLQTLVRQSSNDSYAPVPGQANQIHEHEPHSHEMNPSRMQPQQQYAMSPTPQAYVSHAELYAAPHPPQQHQQHQQHQQQQQQQPLPLPLLNPQQSSYALQQTFVPSQQQQDLSGAPFVLSPHAQQYAMPLPPSTAQQQTWPQPQQFTSPPPPWNYQQQQHHTGFAPDLTPGATMPQPQSQQPQSPPQHFAFPPQQQQWSTPPPVHAYAQIIQPQSEYPAAAIPTSYLQSSPQQQSTINNHHLLYHTPQPAQQQLDPQHTATAQLASQFDALAASQSALDPVALELRFLAKLDAKCSALLARNTCASHARCVPLLEQSLASRRSVYGHSSPHARACCEELVQLLNSQAMRLQQQQQQQGETSASTHSQHDDAKSQHHEDDHESQTTEGAPEDESTSAVLSLLKRALRHCQMQMDGGAAAAAGSVPHEVNVTHHHHIPIHTKHNYSHELMRLLVLRIQTLNNLACVYRKIQRPKTALNLLRQSLELAQQQEASRPVVDHIDAHTGTLSHRDTQQSTTAAASSTALLDATTVSHLNLTAVLSSLARHPEALHHIELAVHQCQTALQRHSHTAMHSSHHHNNNTVPNESSVLQPPPQQTRNEALVLLAIAYHNLGVELEYCQRSTDALRAYKSAYQLLRDEYAMQRQSAAAAAAASTQHDDLHHSHSEHWHHVNPFAEMMQTFKSSYSSVVELLSQQHRQQERRERLQRASGGGPGLRLKPKAPKQQQQQIESRQLTNLRSTATLHQTQQQQATSQLSAHAQSGIQFYARAGASQLATLHSANAESVTQSSSRLSLQHTASSKGKPKFAQHSRPPTAHASRH